jgi:hypothetical protein
VLDAEFLNAGTSEIVKERVVRGAFHGATGGNANLLLPTVSDFAACAGSGVSSGRFVGELALVLPSAVPTAYGDAP